MSPNRILLADLRGDRLALADVAADGAGVRVLGVVQRARTADLATDLRAAARQLGTARTPKRAVCSSEGVTAVCLDLPPADNLTPERLEGLVRWELEPFLESPGQELACGWSTVPGPGPVFAAGLPLAERTRLSDAFAAAGLQLESILPSGAGVAAVARGGDEARQVIEVEPDRLVIAQLEGGRVTRFRLLPARPEEAPELLASIREAGAEVFEPDDAPLPAGALGAARHALGLEGGDRLPAISARTPRAPLLQRTGTHAGVLVALTAVLLLGGDLLLGRRVRAAEVDAERTDAALTQVELAREHQARLGEQQVELERRRTELATEARVLSAGAQRQAYLPALLRALAAALPSDVALDEVREEPDTSLWIEGFALSDLETKTFLRDLTERLRPLGLAPREPVIKRRKGRYGVEGYHFVLRFHLREEQ